MNDNIQQFNFNKGRCLDVVRSLRAEGYDEISEYLEDAVQGMRPVILRDVEPSRLSEARVTVPYVSGGAVQFNSDEGFTTIKLFSPRTGQIVGSIDIHPTTTGEFEVTLYENNAIPQDGEHIFKYTIVDNTKIPFPEINND